ncbi:hypothetical protein [Noviherbaspirillum album]|uniref:hypothetical protein n=1 Tax=Noviherbaspirillum album TaxID=3080276 RepID=UPI003F58903B
MNHATASEAAVATTGGFRGLWNWLADRLKNLINHTTLALIDRFAIAATFFYSGRTKVDGFLTVHDGSHPDLRLS